jgi:hypothetical protein
MAMRTITYLTGPLSTVSEQLVLYGERDFLP